MSCFDRKLGHRLWSESKGMVGPSDLRLLGRAFKGTTSMCKCTSFHLQRKNRIRWLDFMTGFQIKNGI